MNSNISKLVEAAKNEGFDVETLVAGRKILTAIIENEFEVTVLVDCTASKMIMKIPLTLNQWKKIVNGSETIQNIAFNLVPAVREVFITGITPFEWIEIFKDDIEMLDENNFDVSKVFYDTNTFEG